MIGTCAYCDKNTDVNYTQIGYFTNIKLACLECQKKIDKKYIENIKEIKKDIEKRTGKKIFIY